ncbi:hypothetical protein [Glaciimonas soli]|uniref:DUF2946 domain-containing protein n=1 Tax=Glaciimonas soli TaxID=2590999 RepID=A0A843YW62_9BURK|nr:hypothetical protein [Glaciimonas soli]MQR02217.1 hypothetical protein [Glaciimonas soli]
MLRYLNIILIWLLAFALPVQGFAAASMLGCESSHHRYTTTVQCGDNVTGAQGNHAQPAAVQNESKHSHQSLEKNPLNSSHHADAQCQLCAAFCLSAAMAPPSAPDALARAADSIPSSTLEVHFTTHFPDGIERPPHTFFI